MLRQNYKSYLILFCGVLAISTAAIFIRLAMLEADVTVIAAYRLSLSAILTWIIWLISSKTQRVNFTKKNLIMLFLSGLFLAGHFTAWTHSLKLTTVSSSVILVTTTPLWVALASPALLKEPVSKKFYIGMMVAFFGGVVISLKDICIFAGGSFSCDIFGNSVLKENNLGLLLALIGAWLAAGYMLIGRKLIKDFSTIPYTAVVYSIAAIFLLLVVQRSGEKLLGYPGETFLLFFAMAIIPQLFGHSVFNYSLQALPATSVSVALLGEPIGSTILAILLLNEVPSKFEILGGTLILIGIYLAIRQENN